MTPLYSNITFSNMLLFIDVVIFEFNIDILEYSPGVHSVLVMVVDKDTRVAGASISFTTPPLPRVTCGVNM